MNTKIAILSTTGLVLGGLLLTSGQAFAYRGDPAVKGPNYSEERHEAMIKIFENNDYAAWKELVQDRGRVTQVINEENFARFAEAHRLMLEGKNDEALKLREELGLGLRNGSGQGMGRGYGRSLNR